MNNDIIKSIENLKHYTESILTSVYKYKIPSIYNLITEQRYKYSEHGFSHSIYKGDCLLYLTLNLPFHINAKSHIFNMNLKEAVDKKEVIPFLLFLNNRFVKWSDITIIKDCKYSYIMIDRVNRREPDIKCILLPEYVKYQEDTEFDEDSEFVFNRFGECVDEKDEHEKYTTIKVKPNDDIYFEHDRIKTFRAKMKLDPNKKICKNNIFVFNEGLLDTNMSLNGLNTFTIEDRKPIELANKMLYKAFYNNKSNNTLDNIVRIENKDYLTNIIQHEKEIPEYIQKLNQPFDFNYKQHDSYSNNIANSLNYIMKYNPALMNDVYKNKSNIESRIYKGSHVRKFMDKKGHVTMSRKIGNCIENYVIILVNGEIYKRYSSILYLNKNFRFLAFDIKDEDTVEFLFFKNIDNRIFDMTLWSGGSDLYLIDPTINMENSKLFTIDIKEKEFNTERKNSIQYDIDFEYEKLNKTEYRIIPKDNFYYDRNLSLVSNRQFRYAYQIIRDEDTMKFKLPYEFRFCNNLNKFMVFLNGRMLNKNNYKITIIKPTRPFDNISTYINIPMQKNDKIEVFYIPDEFEEIYTKDDLDLSGNIILDRSKIPYNLSKDLYLVFVNGKKININQMYDVSSNRLIIKSDTQSTKNLTIIKHIQDDIILKELFEKSEDMLNTIINEIEPSELNKLYNNIKISNTEKDIKEDQIPMKQVLYQIIRDYWMRPYINTGEDFVYDFDDDDGILEKDSEGNIIINAMDANMQYER